MESITNCDIVLPSQKDIEEVFFNTKEPEIPRGWSVSTPSSGRSGSGRKNRGRKLPTGRLNRNWRRRRIAFEKMPLIHFEALKAPRVGSLYDFLLESRMKPAKTH